ncbi:MAG: flagellar export protein FliJ [Planctomycetes bacterium]|nr:flagellar export protein FliJ [Planctomycetota bacterium]
MKRFQFRLQRLVKWKEQRRRQAELAQSQASAELDAAREKVVQLVQRLEETARDLASEVGQPLGPDRLRAFQQYAGAVGQDLLAAEAGLHRAVQRLQEAERRRARIAVEVEVLACLRQRHWQQYRKETLREQQGRLDELALRRWSAATVADSTGAAHEKETEYHA